MSFRREFRGKSWMDWTRAGLLGVFALISLKIGIAEIEGIRDANGVVRHDAVVPCLISAPILAALSAMFIVRALARSRPIVQLRREGIICRRVGPRNGMWLPSRLALAIDLLSGRGFRQSLFYFEWESLAQVKISGLPMRYLLTVYGHGTDRHGNTITSLTLAQHEFGAPIHEVASVLNAAISNPKIREAFPGWQIPPAK